MRKLILRCFHSPGDVVMLTAAVRNLHQAHPHQFLIDVRTSGDGNQRPGHFLHGFFQFLKQRLVLTPAGVLCGDIQLSQAGARPFPTGGVNLPNELAKGGTTGEIVGRDIVEAHGGIVRRTATVEGISTTALLELAAAERRRSQTDRNADALRGSEI